MRSMPAGCVHCVKTSPPYWGLRDYGIPPSDWANGWNGVYGLEPTPEMFIENSVEVFGDVRRILRDDGVLFLNLGDSYNAYNGGAGPSSALSQTQSAERPALETGYGLKNKGLKPGDLCNVPHRVATALQADGWFWRSTIIWGKRSPMPESVSGWRWVRCKKKVGRKPVDWSVVPKDWDSGEGAHDKVAGGNYRTNGSDRVATVAVFEECSGCEKCRDTDGLVLRRGKWRPTNAHEYVFLFSKSERYFCDGDAVQEIAGGSTPGNATHGTHKAAKAYESGDRHFRKAAGLTNMVAHEKRNPRSVWMLSSEPFKGAHFATFPTALVKKCVEAGTSSGGCCPACESPLAPIVQSERVPTRPGTNHKIKLLDGNPHSGHGIVANLDPERHVAVTRVIGYRPTCSCNAGDPIGCMVFDPFSGSGTTLQVAKALGRRWAGTEINPEYAKLAEVRIQTPPKWKDAKPKRPRPPKAPDQMEMFN